MEYTEMHTWEVLTAIMNCKTVYVLDKETRQVMCLNATYMNEVANILRDAKESNNDRYYFWTECQEVEE